MDNQSKKVIKPKRVYTTKIDHTLMTDEEARKRYDKSAYNSFYDDLTEAEQIRYKKSIIGIEMGKKRREKERKEHYQENKEEFKEKAKKYREENKEKLAEQRKKYYKKNKEKIAENLTKQIICECGAKIIKNSLWRHKKTKNHCEFIEKNKKNEKKEIICI